MNIIITGASKGIGASLARNFGYTGDNQLFLISRDEQSLNCLKDEIILRNQGAKVELYNMDLTVQANINNLFASISKKVKFIDILINNAGILQNKGFEDFSVNEIEAVFQVNYMVPAVLIHKFLPLLSASEGAHVLNVGSMGGVQGSVKFPGLSHYSASKGALAVLTECLAEEYKTSRISFNCLALGSVQTEMLEKAFPGYQAPVSSEEMADFIADFATNAPKFIKGKIIPVSSSTP